MLSVAMVWWVLGFLLGFQFKVLGLDCGGDLPAKPPGEITNPDVDGDSSYDDNTECVWTITAEVNKVIEVQFYYLETEGDANLPCLYDYVQVFDGSVDDTLMGQFCGKELPELLTSSSSIVTIRFKSDVDKHFHGFGIVYFEDELTLCGPLQDNLSGMLTSSNRDLTDSYDEVLCSWKIIVQPYKKKIQLYVLETVFQSSDSCLHAFVYDANTVYGTYCGTDTLDFITSTSNYMLVDFHSENIIQEERFQALYVANDPDMLCDAIFSPRYFTPPDRDKNGYFDDDLDCVWVITTPEGFGIQFNFESVDIQFSDIPDCFEDYVELFDGGLAPETSLRRLCGVLTPEPIVTGNLLLVHFTSDARVNIGRGFEATYRLAQGMKRCGPLKTDIVGHFSSTDINPGVGFDLDINCTWTIQLWLDPDKLIELYLTTLDIPSPAEECGSEYLEIYDDTTTFGTYCGTNGSQTFISTSNTLNVQYFPQGGINNKKGFTVFYSAIDSDHQCGGILSSPTGTLTSVDRNQDGLYDQGLHCMWIIVAPVGMHIEAEFEKLHVYKKASWSTCWDDYLKLFDGGYQPGIYKQYYYDDRICGREPPLLNITQSNFMYVLFHSENNVRPGFELRYNFTRDTQTTETTSSTVTMTTTRTKETIVYTSTKLSSLQNDVEGSTDMASTLDETTAETLTTMITGPFKKSQRHNASAVRMTKVWIEESGMTSIQTTSDGLTTSELTPKGAMTTISAMSGNYDYDFTLFISYLVFLYI